MPHHEQYILRVTAGATYDTSKHEDVHVNTEKPINISSEHLDARLHIRVKDYRGLPPNSPSTSPYFSTPQHPYDRYSIAFSFTPKRHIPGDHLVFGNDFAHPIRDRLPPLFDKAFGIVKWWIDPGLDGDVYADEPYLYGALLSSINVLRIGGKAGGSSGSASEEEEDEEEENDDAAEAEAEAEADPQAIVYEEGAEGSGVTVRSRLNIPSTPAQRQKHFLSPARRQEFDFEAGREYKCDFFNPYVDFNEFALRIGYGLPAISIIGHWDGQPLRTHSLRYVLKDRNTNTELFVVIFQLVPTQEARREEGVEDAEEKLRKVHGGEEKVGGEEKLEAERGAEDDELD